MATRRERCILPIKLVRTLWPDHFEGAGGEAEPQPMDNDPRLGLIKTMQQVLCNNGDATSLSSLLEGYDLSTATSVTLLYNKLLAKVAMEDFALQLYDNPRLILGSLNMALSLLQYAQHPEADISKEAKITARLVGVPSQGVSDLKSNLAGKFIAVVGNVLRVSSISPMVLRADFKCPQCQSIMPRQFVDGKFNPPPSCIGDECRARSFELMRETAVTVDYQKLKLQEIENETSEAGRMPRTVEVELTGDLVDTCIPGDIVTIAGIVKSMNAEFAVGRMNKRAKSSGLYVQFISANSLVNTRHRSRGGSGGGGGGGGGSSDASSMSASAGNQGKEVAGTEVRPGQPTSMEFSSSDLLAIREIATDAFPFELVASSLCPGIFGHDIVKAGLVLGLFGGTPRESEVAIRSDLHVLVVGDPGLGKSQMLAAVHQVAPRSVYVCGNTTTTTGLTVTVCKEGSDVGLEAGALVLSDQGVCCIDEFDKMSCDPHSLLEAMEQQQISVAKSGVVANLSARCCVIAAANPAGGHYDRSKSVAENLKMSTALLSRFDLVFILLDKADGEHDRHLSEHIMRLHALADGTGSAGSGGGGCGGRGGEGGGRKRSRTTFSIGGAAAGAGGVGAAGFVEASSLGSANERTLSQRLRLAAAKYSKDPLPPELLRKYIAYAKTYVNPKLTLDAARVLQRLYLTMRAEARNGRCMPITTRQLESLVRLAQARARVELREEVRKQDAIDVVELMQESLLEACTNDVGAIDFGKSKGLSLSKQVKTFIGALNKEASRKGSAMFMQSELLAIANQLKLAISDFDGFLDVLRTECYLLKKGPKVFQLQTSNFTGSQLTPSLSSRY